MGRPLLSGLHAGYVASLAPAAMAFERAVRRPQVHATARLRQLLRANAATVYGRTHRFASIGSVQEFQRRVPVADYAALSPYIDRIARGEPRVLTSEPVLMMERSSGSASGNKLIPFTQGLRQEFGRAVAPWLFDLYRRRKGLWGRRSYWSVSPAARPHDTTPGGLRVGFDDDTEYFGRLEAWALRRMMAVPPHVAKLRSVGIWRRATLIGLARAADLGFISVWSPSFLTLLVQSFEEDVDSILAQLPLRRAEQVRRDRQHMPLSAALWPALDTISCWTDGPSARALADLRRHFPTTHVQSKGLLATEGVVSFPLGDGPGQVVAATSHVLEFIDLARPDAAPKFVDGLRVGAQYSPLLTTGGGFYRYNLHDAVECVGYYRKTPRIRFIGKLDRSTDLSGEKLTVPQVEAALPGALSQLRTGCTFAMLAPVLKPTPHYRLFLETTASDEAIGRAAATLDAALQAGYHYRYCRDLGQLGSVSTTRVYSGWRRYHEHLLGEGQRAGDIKATVLDTRTDWDTVFPA